MIAALFWGSGSSSPAAGYKSFITTLTDQQSSNYVYTIKKWQYTNGRRHQWGTITITPIPRLVSDVITKFKGYKQLAYNFLKQDGSTIAHITGRYIIRIENKLAIWLASALTDPSLWELSSFDKKAVVLPEFFGFDQEMIFTVIRTSTTLNQAGYLVKALYLDLNHQHQKGLQKKRKDRGDSPVGLTIVYSQSNDNATITLYEGALNLIYYLTQHNPIAHATLIVDAKELSLNIPAMATPYAQSETVIPDSLPTITTTPEPDQGQSEYPQHSQAQPTNPPARH